MNFELMFAVVAVLCIALDILSNAEWCERCQRMNDTWYSRLVDVAKTLDLLEERIKTLEDKLEDDGR